MSTFMGFPSGPIVAQHFSGRRGPVDSVLPFIVPTNQTRMLPAFTGYQPAGQYGSVASFSESKPVVPEPQEIAVNALPICQPSTPTTMTSSNVPDFAGDNLLTAFQMSTTLQGLKTWYHGTMSNFMGFPSGPIFAPPPQHFSGRRGPVDSILPFIVPTNQTRMLPAFTGYQPAGQYGSVASFSESKPVVPEPQEIAVNALHPKSSGTCIPICQPSTPTTMTSSNAQDFAGDNLISAYQMSTGANAPGDTINNFEVPSSRMSEGSQYPMVVKPSIVPYSNVTPRAHSPSTKSSLGDRFPTKSRVKSQSKSGKDICQICGKSYARLKAHMHRIHSQPGVKPYRCGVCGRAFIWPYKLYEHFRTHSGEKPYDCPICQKRFPRTYSVTLHLRTHTGERPYRCDNCGDTFADGSTLTKHKRTHSGEKPYHCKICKRLFTQSSTRNRHMKTHNN